MSAKIFAVVNRKGGVAKTTTAVKYAPHSKPAETYWNLVEKIYHEQI